MASTYLTRTPSSGSTTTVTYSCWYKRNKIAHLDDLFSAGDTTPYENCRICQVDSSNIIRIGFYATGGTFSFQVDTNRLIRDTSAWYHIVVAIDTTQATASDRVKLWVNGVQETSFATANYPAQNFNLKINNPSYPQYIGNLGGRSLFAEQSLAHVHYIDGTAYDASYFGETDSTTGIWKPKTAPSVTYGTNGFFLKFENSGSMGTDSSGNGNNFTVSGNLTQTVDSPSNVFCTMSPIIKTNSSGTVYTNGNTSISGSSGSWQASYGSIGATKGKWYYEAKVTTFTDLNGSTPRIGWGALDNINANDSGVYYYGINWEDNGALKGGQSGSGYSPDLTGYTTYAQGDILGCAIDLDNDTITYYKNGTVTTINALDYSSYTTNVRSSQGFFVAPQFVFYDGTGSDIKIDFNFGNGYFGTTPVASAGSNGNGAIFEYDVPTGYYALNTKNINTYG